MVIQHIPHSCQHVYQIESIYGNYILFPMINLYNVIEKKMCIAGFYVSILFFSFLFIFSAENIQILQYSQDDVCSYLRHMVTVVFVIRYFDTKQMWYVIELWSEMISFTYLLRKKKIIQVRKI